VVYRLHIWSQSVVLIAVLIAGRICGLVKIAVSSFPAPGVTAAKQVQNRSLTRNVQIFAIGFLWNQSSAVKLQDNPTNGRRLIHQEPN
jgi:hypothetical protein